jgi:ABC-type multidrug transport system ATPase subunit
VTGKLVPGRVVAVMGPSDVGNTTFLSAIVGKATGCETNLVYKVGYKRIIGFVPRDDIVHGNLTIQEKLWFNARL